WEARERELRELCDRHRRTDGRYDVICPGSGGKDSMYASHVLKHKYGMHPLTVTWAPHIYTDIGWKNFQAWIQAGFDNVKFSRNEGDLGKVFLGGVSAQQLIDEHGLERNDLAPYLPPTPDAAKRWGGEVRYLGYYLKWTPQWAYYHAVENLGFEANPERTEGT